MRNEIEVLTPAEARRLKDEVRRLDAEIERLRDLLDMAYYDIPGWTEMYVTERENGKPEKAA